MNNKIKILGLDLSLTSPGLAVIEIRKEKPKLIEVAHIKTKAEQELSLRLNIIKNFIESFYLKHSPHFVVRESVLFNFRNTKTVESLCYVAGVSFLVCRNHTIEKIAPNKIKELVTGTKQIIKNNEKAEKERVADAVRKILKLDGEIPFPFGSSDESDACASALAFAIQKGLIKI